MDLNGNFPKLIQMTNKHLNKCATLLDMKTCKSNHNEISFQSDYKAILSLILIITQQQAIRVDEKSAGIVI